MASNYFNLHQPQPADSDETFRYLKSMLKFMKTLKTSSKINVSYMLYKNSHIFNLMKHRLLEACAVRRVHQKDDAVHRAEIVLPAARVSWFRKGAKLAGLVEENVKATCWCLKLISFWTFVGV